MIPDFLLSREWFAVASSREVEPGQLLARRLLGRDVVLWRSPQGVHCWRDLYSTEEHSFHWAESAASG